MTRINCGVHPSELCNRHLLAEHREIKRIPNMVRSGRARLDGIPGQFTLGDGHVRFFYDKIGYLRDRYSEIHAECIRRGFNVTDFSDSFSGIPDELMHGYIPTDHDRRIVRRRIAERLNGKHIKQDRT